MAALPSDWWTGGQFDRGGQFYAPSYTEDTAGEKAALDNWNNLAGVRASQAAQGIMSTNQSPAGTKMWTTSPADQAFMDAYGKGGRQSVADWGLQIDPNDQTKATRAYEMTQAQRDATGLNNGRTFLNYSFDPKTNTWNADPTSATTGEAAQNVSNRVTAGRAAAIMAMIAAGSVAAAGGGLGAGAEAGTGGAAAAPEGGLASAASPYAGSGFAGDPATLAGAAGGNAGEVAAGVPIADSPYSNFGSPEGYTTGSSTNLGATAGNVGGYTPGGSSLLDTARNAYNVAQRGRQLAGALGIGRGGKPPTGGPGGPGGAPGGDGSGGAPMGAYGGGRPSFAWHDPAAIPGLQLFAPGSGPSQGDQQITSLFGPDQAAAAVRRKTGA